MHGLGRASLSLRLPVRDAVSDHLVSTHFPRSLSLLKRADNTSRDVTEVGRGGGVRRMGLRLEGLCNDAENGFKLRTRYT